MSTQRGNGETLVGAIPVDPARFAALAQVCTAAVACQRPSPAIADGFPSSIESERLRSFGLARRRRRRSTRRGRGTRHPRLSPQSPVPSLAVPQRPARRTLLSSQAGWQLALELAGRLAESSWPVLTQHASDSENGAR